MPLCSLSSKTERRRTKKRRNDNSSQVPRKSSGPPKRTERLHDPLKEEIADILDVHNISLENRPELETIIVNALEELATKGGETDMVRRNVRKSILQSTSLSPFEAEDVSTKLVGRAREMSLISKVQDSSDWNRKKWSTVERPKYKFTEDTVIEIIEIPETIKLERKSKVEPDLKAITGTRELDDATSVRMDLINVPKNHTPSIIKGQIKQNLFKSLSDIVRASKLTQVKKEDIRNKLLNIMEKDLDKSTLLGKEDLPVIKKLMLNDINQSLDDSSISKDNIKYLKLKLASTLEKEFDESILKDKRIRKERLSRDLDDVIEKLPISGNEKTDLKDTLTNIYDETDETTKDKSTQSPPDGPENYTFQGPKLKKHFKPAHHSTPVQNKGNAANRDNNAPKKNGQINFHNNVPGHSDIPSEEAEFEYTNKIGSVINTWINSTPLTIERYAKNKIVRQLTGDIVDRKKYFQITPRAKPTYDEDLDNLKYQLYRRMNKQVGVDDLTPVIDDADELLIKINRIEVPMMIVPPGFVPREDSYTDDGSQATSTAEYDNLIIPLHENIQEILDSHNIIGEDREVLEAELMSALEELALGDGDIDAVTKKVLDIIKQYTHMDGEDAEEISREFVGVAKEIANVRKKGRPFIEKSGIEMKKKDFQEAMLRELGNVFEGCPMSPEKRRLMESQLAEQYAQDLGISLKDSDNEILPTDTQNLEADIEDSVNHWIQSLPINVTDSNEELDINNKKKEFISKLKNIVPLGDFEKMKEETYKSMLELPLNFDMKNNGDLLNEKVEELIDKVVYVPQKSGSKKPGYGISLNGLTDYIDNWLDNLEIDYTAEVQEKIKNLKKDLAYNLIHKIGEMNVDPEIFNDDNLYDDVIRDELHTLFDDLTITNPDFPNMKEELIEKIKEARRRAHDEIAGQNYKQNLRNTINGILPDPKRLSQDEQASLEVMKDQLADAFINLHYSGSNEDLRANLKNKISSELDMFCKDYLNKHGTPLNSQKLNNDLYNALKNVPAPADDSIRYEVEQVRIRHEINMWMKTLPLQPQTPAEILARNKMVYVLSKKIFEIETELDDSEDVPLMQKEILKFLKKMPLTPGEEKNSLEFADRLIQQLKATEMSRKYSESCMVDINADGNISSPRGRGARVSITKESVCPYYKSLLEKRNAAMKARPQFPPCSLSPEDMDHLERIRQRTCLAPRCITSLLKAHKRNAGVGPRPVDAGSQTELRPESFGKGQSGPDELCPAANSQKPRPCPGVPVNASNQSGYPERRPTIPSSIPPPSYRGEVQPHIIIKQYYWDTVDSSNLQDSESPPGACCKQQRAPSYKKPSTPPYSDVGTSPCKQAGTSPYQTPDTPPYQQASTQPNHQENFTQQRMPCDHNFPCVGSKSTQSQRYPQWSPERSFYVPQDRSSHGSIPCPRSPCTPTPCMSPLSSPFEPQQQSSPIHSPGFSFRQNDGRMPKRDGLQDHTPCSSSRPFRKERIIELGSLDDLYHARPKKRNEHFDWSYAKFPEEDNFWGTPCMRRVILDEGIDDSMCMEREKREERVKCKCKERIVPKFARSHNRPCHRHMSSNEDSNNLNRCSKCCGVHCPYPSHLYFRE